MEKTLATPEILEHIFLQADLRTVLLSQQVCHYWHSLITHSPSIQRHLFFLPDATRKTSTINPLLRELFPQWFSGNTTERPRDFQSLPLAQTDRNDAFAREEASWRRMFPRQPPVRTLRRCTRHSLWGQKWMEFADTSMAADDDDNDMSAGPAAKQPAETGVAAATRYMPMEALYRLVVDGHGDSCDWTFIWGDGAAMEHIDPRPWYDESTSQAAANLAAGLDQYGVVFLCKRVTTWTGSLFEKFDPLYRLAGVTMDFRQSERSMVEESSSPPYW